MRTQSANTGSRLTVRPPRGFSLPHAVCSYGYFLLAPNRWEPTTKTLHRPFAVGDRSHVRTRISQPKSSLLRIDCDRRVTTEQARTIRQQARRMLRLDEDLTPWWRVCPTARRARFDRLFRSPNLFEDMVKTITGCNVSWPNTMRMNRLLCDRVGDGGFPTAAQLSRIRIDTLQRWCKVGYRARRIVELARNVVHARLDLDRFEHSDAPTEQVHQELQHIHGIGPYAAANLCQLLGRYDRVPIDTETCRHFRSRHRISKTITPAKLNARITRHYDAYAPYQFLAYWFELWQDYEARYGRATRWTSDEVGNNFTASVLNKSN